MAPSIAARRVDGVQGARCPKGSAEMAALSVPRARTFESNLPPDEEYGRDGTTRCAAELRRRSKVRVERRDDHPVFQTETSALGRAGQLVDAPSVGSENASDEAGSIGQDAAAPEPQLAPHTKRAKQHKL